jgi:signal transduction histidine kinase
VTLFGNPDISNAAIPVVLYATGRYGGQALRWIGLASAIVGAALASATYALSNSSFMYYVRLADFARIPELLGVFFVGFLAAAALFVISWAIGMLVRTWRVTQDSRAAQAAAIAHQRSAERDVAIEQERTRIARDMHDVVAHSLAVVIAQADGARYAMKSSPETADEALGTISTTAREALADVRILLGQLRHSQEAGPQPALDDLDRLLDQLRSAGLDIRREDAGVPTMLGTGQQLAVYRIVQESLTNVLRHGDRDHQVVVRFAWGSRDLELEISSGMKTDEVSASGGHGIDGMRERAQLAGGRLVAGPHGESFRVTAVLPLQSEVTA